jgi:hypothetical protein
MLKEIRKRLTRDLSCVLTQDELLVAGAELAQAGSDIRSIESRLASIKAEFKAKSAEAEARAMKHELQVSTRQEPREVACESVMDFTAGTYTIYRLDTGGCVETRPLHENERQMEIHADEDDASDMTRAYAGLLDVFGGSAAEDPGAH